MSDWKMVMNKIAITALVGEFDHFVDEANQMTLSGQGLDERFTFVLFVEPEVLDKIKIRKNVMVYPYKSPSGYYDQYRYAKSLEFVTANENILKEYTHIIKTDTDVFFSDHLNDHLFDEKIYFGRGHYKYNNPRMYEVANALGYTSYSDIVEPNSTVLGTSADVIDLMRSTDDLCKKVFYYLCPDGEWGKLHYLWGKDLYAGTSTLIAQEIAAVSSYPLDHIVITNKIDGDCTSSDDISSVYHVHQWHVDNLYSKFSARRGEYDNLEYRDDNSIASYGLNIYLKNKREVNE